MDYYKIKSIFTTGIMNNDTEIFDNYTSEILESIKTYEKIENALTSMKNVKDEYNSQSDYLSEEIFESGRN